MTTAAAGRARLLASQAEVGAVTEVRESLGEDSRRLQARMASGSLRRVRRAAQLLIRNGGFLDFLRDRAQGGEAVPATDLRQGKRRILARRLRRDAALLRDILGDAVEQSELPPEPNRSSCTESLDSTADLTFSTVATFSDIGFADLAAKPLAGGDDSGPAASSEPVQAESSATAAVTPLTINHSCFRFTRSHPTSDPERVTLTRADQAPPM
ncbi:hypothetical protein ABZ504_48800 [Streptomyces mirabilis]|uniref:hypothetical protein n=1 Tax=Streptomyces mirabilis TaxID=68239 RepID=UPI003406CA81